MCATLSITISLFLALVAVEYIIMREVSLKEERDGGGEKVG